MGLGTSILIHNMWMSISGNAEQLRKAADDLDVLMEANRAIYMERAKISENELIELMNAETYLTPEQAVEKGFADEVMHLNEATKNGSVEQMQQRITELQEQLKQQLSFKEDLRQIYNSSHNKEPKETKNIDIAELLKGMQNRIYGRNN